MRCILMIIIFIISANNLYAQTITIQTGEHEDFSRVVMRIPSGASWSLVRTASGFGVNITTAKIFDISNFWEKIPRTRILDVSPGSTNSQLNFVVGCECGLDAFLVSPTYLVVDIHDDTDINADFKQILTKRIVLQEVPEGGVSSSENDNKLFDGYGNFTAPSLDFSVDVQGNTAVNILPKIWNLNAVLKNYDMRSLIYKLPSHATLKNLSILSESILIVENDIIEDLTNTVNQDLLLSSVDVINSREIIQSESAQSGFILSVDDEVNNNKVIIPGLLVETVIERDKNLINRNLDQNKNDISCYPDSYFDLPNWGSDKSFFSQISEARNVISQKSDSSLEDNVLLLSKIYVYFGFGLEAQQVFEIDGILNQQRIAVNYIAQILDNEVVNLIAPASQVGCSGPVSLWAFLGKENGSSDITINRNAIIFHFKSLPIQIRTILRQRVVESFLALGDINAAEQVIDSSFSFKEENNEYVISKANVSMENDDFDSVVINLTEMAETNTRMTPDVVLDLVNASVSAGSSMPDEIFELVRVHRFEQGESQISIDLAKSEFRARLNDKEFDIAMDVLRDISNLISDEDFIVLINSYASEMISSGSDSEFLNFSLSNFSTGFYSITQNMISEKLIKLNFIDAAEQFLKDEISGPAAVDRRYLRAEIALRKGNFDEINFILQDLSGDRFDAMQDKVRARILGFDSSLSDDINNNLDLQSWRSRDWVALSESESILLENASTLALAPLRLSAPDASIQYSKNLLQTASDTRNLISELLIRFDGSNLE